MGFSRAYIKPKLKEGINAAGEAHDERESANHEVKKSKAGTVSGWPCEAVGGVADFRPSERSAPIRQVPANSPCIPNFSMVY